MVTLGLGYAFLQADLTINGVGKVKASNWSVYFDHLVLNPNNVSLSSEDVAASIDQTTNTDISFSITLNRPGDFYEFTVDVINDGNIDAMVGVISNKLEGTEISATNPLPDFAKYTVTYLDGMAIAPNHYLKQGESETYRIRLEYRTDITADELPESVQSITLNFGVQYVQADSNAFERSTMLGSYISMVPDSSSYVIPASTTGYEVSSTPTDQTITPNELTLWRVIRVNSDGSMDAVSEYVSSTSVFFRGTTGFANYVNELQTISQQYAKTGYTIATRIVGYDGQSLTISDTSDFDGTYNPTDNPEVSPPSTTSMDSPTTGTGQEYGQGVLGDSLYLKDYQLLSDVYSTDTTTYGSTGLVAYKVDAPSTAADYWIASRLYYYDDDSGFSFSGRTITSSGILGGSVFRYYGYGFWGSFEGSASIRPVITLKSGVEFTGGNGFKTSPYVIGS